MISEPDRSKSKRDATHDFETKFEHASEVSEMVVSRVNGGGKQGLLEQTEYVMQQSLRFAGTSRHLHHFHV